ncbi:GOLPH3/VPS74 family protein [Glycomyces tenuis]|uniref:GOLPH3/VPS74 family protein n=1 Tax=Glycomyces tenuis TaxID=58116 RepID=UPI0004166833|nr:GPP34 family phosphoprotein [Glycomyces tenuis]
MNIPHEMPPELPRGDGRTPEIEIRWRVATPASSMFEPTDELVLCCLDQTTWRPVTHQRVIGLGLAACVMGQLLAARQVHLVDRSIVMSHSAQAPTMVMPLEVWEMVKAEHTAQQVKTWLLFLAEQGMGTGLFVRVTERMASRGLVAIDRRGRRGRRTAYFPADPSAAAWPLVRIRQGIKRDALEGRDAFLAGLLARMGFEPLLTDSGADRTRLDRAIRAMEMPMQQLLTHLDVLVGQAAMTRRF